MGYDTTLDAVNSVTDARGKTSRVSYNAQGRPLTTTDPKGNISTLSYAPNGLDVVSIQNANGQVVASYAYNALRQVVSATDRSGTTTYSYTPWGEIAGSVDPQNRASQYQYNAQDRLALVLFADAPVGGVRDWQSLSGFTYDAAGRVKTQTDEAGLTLAYEYNNLDGVTKVSYPDGTSSEVDYVVSNLPGVVKDRSGRKSYYDYDPMKRLSRVQDAQGNALQMDYDLSGNMTRLLDAKGNQTKWVYDALGRVTTKAYHDGTTEAFAYSQGLLSQTKGARGQIIRYSYDDNANVSLVDFPNQADVSFAYNKLDDVTQVVDGIGTHTFSYDNFGRMDALDGPFANDGQSYAYDALQRLQSQSVQKGASGGLQSQSYAYDALERLTSLTSNADTFSYGYVGNTDLLASLDLPNGSKVEQGYDALQRLTSVVNRTGQNNLARYAYGYDNRDVRTGMQVQLATNPLTQISYTYDAIDQLTGEQATGGTGGTAYTNAFQYDSMGNRTRHENTRVGQSSVSRHTPNALNQLTALSLQSGAGARQTTGFSYDLGGNMTEQVASDGSKTLYSYDDADRLNRIEWRAANGMPQRKSEFVYDYASRKAISRELNWTNGAWVVQSEKRRVFDGLDVVQERDDNNLVTAQVVRDGNIAGILSRTTPTGTSYFHYDGSGNLVALSSETGALVGSYSYDAFGNTLEVTGVRAQENPYRFSTKELHSQSGLYDFGFRFYSPGTGRWINRDPIREAGGLNIYAMVWNSPTNDVDEYGLQAGDQDNNPQIAAAKAIQQKNADEQRARQQANQLQGQLPFWVGRGGGGRGSGGGKGSVGRGGGTSAKSVGRTGRSPRQQPQKKTKAVNLPSWKKCKIDMDEVMSGHQKGGSRLNPGNKKTLFPSSMSRPQIERAIRQAYRYGQKIKSQGDRVKIRGKFGNLTIDMWVNKATGTIETAYTVE